MKNTSPYTPITPGQVFLPYFQAELTEAELWTGVSRNEFGNRPSGCRFIDCFAGIIRQIGYTNAIQIARKLGIDRIALHHTIMSLTGITPKDWIDWWLLSSICEMLEKTNWTIKEIAQKLNFTSQVVLSSYFSQHKNMPPSEWRIRKKNRRI